MAAASDFDIAALYAALDAQRGQRGMTWSAVAREISGGFAQTPAKPISASTLTGIATRVSVEGDGVLQMLLWLDRTPESFVAGHPHPSADDTRLPVLAADRILRFDTKKLYDALETQRAERGMTWRHVAAEIGGVTPAALTRLADGGRTSFPHVMRIVKWLRRPAAFFTRAGSW
jgi:hypothetical protein